MPDELNELRDRVTRVEGELQTMRRRFYAGGLFLLGGLVGALALVTTGYQPGGATRAISQTVRAPFRVVDTQGRNVLEIGTYQGNRHLALFAKKGAAPAVLLACNEPNGGSVAIANTAGRPMASLGTDGNGGMLHVFDATRDRAYPVVGVLGRTDDGGTIEVYDKAGNAVFKIPKGEKALFGPPTR
jgi:hypothetical protein